MPVVLRINKPKHLKGEIVNRGPGTAVDKQRLIFSRDYVLIADSRTNVRIGFVLPPSLDPCYILYHEGKWEMTTIYNTKVLRKGREVQKQNDPDRRDLKFVALKVKDQIVDQGYIFTVQSLPAKTTSLGTGRNLSAASPR